MRRIALALALLLAGISQSFAAAEGFTVPTCGLALVPPYTAGGFNAIVIDVNGNTCVAGGGLALPTGATPITGTFSGADTTTAAATLAGVASKTTYICSFTVTGLGATAATPVTVTVATLIGSTTLSYTYFFPAGAAVPSQPLVINYSPCIASNAVNTAITITVPGAAGNTATQINATGYQL
jgi:hypothetical protein